MLGALYWNDVSDLSIFKCKVCADRLQHPIMQVGSFGNICGNCYDKSVFTNVTGDTDIEKILSKLHVPCKYQEKGCSFEDTFVHTSLHEKICKFRNIECPLASLQVCENVTLSNIVNHFQTSHEDKVINAKGDSVLIPNPTKADFDVYLINVRKQYFIFRCGFNNMMKEYLYSLYCLNNDCQKVSFTIVGKYNIFNITSDKIAAVGYSEVSSPYGKHVLVINSEVLVNINCEREISVLLHFEEEENESKGFHHIIECEKCTVCGRDCIDGVYDCDNCRAVFCSRCTPSDDRHYCGGKFQSTFQYGWVTLNSSINQSMFLGATDSKVKCNCNKVYRDKSHLKIYLDKCPYEQTANCKWEAVYTKITAHVKEKHSPVAHKVNILAKNKAKNVISILKCDRIFVCKYELVGNTLKLTMGEIGTIFSNLPYVWEIIMKKENICNSTWKNCEHFYSATVISLDVANYVVNQQLEFVVSVKCRDI